MRKIHSTSVLYRYLLSYFSVILLSCAVIGLFLFNASIRELNAAAARETQNKLELLAADLQNQREVMSDIALSIATTIYYKPYYRERNKVYERDLIEDFAKYDGRSPLADDYFLLYRDDAWVFKKTAKNTFSVYAAHELGLSDSAALYEKLNETGAFTIILPEDGSSRWILFAYPVPISGLAQPSDTACLCFVIRTQTLEKRLTDVAGALSGMLDIRYDDRLVASISAAPQDSTYEESVLTAASPDGMFTVDMTPASGMYAGLDYFLWLNLGIVSLFVLLFLGLSALIAYHNYRPIGELAAKYGASGDPARGLGNEIWRIDSLLKNVLERQRVSQAHLHEQFMVLKRQQLQLLLGGGYGPVSGGRDAPPDLPFPGPLYGVLVIGTAETPEGGAAGLCGLIEDLSGDGITLYAVELKGENRYAVLAGLNEESRLQEAVELIGAVMEASGIRYTLGTGPLYPDINRLPASLLAALSSCGVPRAGGEAANPGSAAKWYDGGPVVRMDAAIRCGHSENAREQLALFFDSVRNNPSLLMRRCMLSDALNAVIRVSCEISLPVPQEQIGPLLVPQDDAAFMEGLFSIVDALCQKIKEKDERRHAKELGEILSYIEEHALEYELSHERVAQHFGLSDSHLYRIMKEGTGNTYKDYLTLLRMRKAEILLAGEGLSVAETCRRVGYSSIPYFIKTFKKFTGYTPANYKSISKKSTFGQDKLL